MSLDPGKKLGPYEIVSLLGAGGMGEVYRARDHRLERTVAVKVLPAGLTPTPAVRARFEREARAIAALSHPNICSIHDVGSEDGTDYLVMEYLEGETLSGRLARGALPLNLLLRYGVQIAEGLHQAHRAGVTHRDLKPGNIMLTQAGVKLLDFGLAKILEKAAPFGDQSNSPTQTAPLTAEGTIVGTLQYMSPEQLEGRTVDHRTDIFALGVILYEMATGQRPFNGSSGASVMAAILSSDPPPIRSLQPALPPALERITMAALEKSPDERWQTAHDVARQLRWLSEGLSSGEAPAPAARVGRRAPVPLLIGGVAAALLTWGVMRSLQRPVDPPRTVRLHFVSLPDVAWSGDINPFALAPDGRALCFLGSTGGVRSLFVRSLDSFAIRKIDGSEGALGPFWSPDGKWIGFSARGKLWKTQVSGETPPEAICDVSVAGAIGTWRDRTILFTDGPEGRSSIFRVPDSGGTSQIVTSPSASEGRYSSPYFLPDGEHFLYQAHSANSIDRDLVVASLKGSTKIVLAKNVSQVRSIGKDQLTYVRDGKLLAHRYDPDLRALIGEPVKVADDVSFFYITGLAHFDASPSGVVVYRTNTTTGRLSLVDRSGVERKSLDDEGTFLDADLSPDGRTAAVTVLNRATGLADIWLYDLVRRVRDRFTSEPGMEFSPLWSRDGRTIFYSTGQGGLPFVVRRSVGGTADQAVTPRGSFRMARSLSPDQETLYVVERNTRTRADILRVAMKTKQSVPFLNSGFSESDPRVSPDGKWLAYSSDATGKTEVYLQGLSSENAGRTRLSSSGGGNPQWSADGRQLFFQAKDRRTLHVTRSGSGRWDDTKIEELFVARQDLNDYAVLPDGQTFLLLESTPGPGDSLFHVIVGWR